MAPWLLQKRRNETVSVDAIAAMYDAELGLFMKKHRLPDGGYELPIDGRDKLSKHERNCLAQPSRREVEGPRCTLHGTSRPSMP
ncbi:uncharacterized protein UV8b_01233 [Ustilaginoidea virens]|uniref:Uncharacterized protein n=1 Tax=Ustilaginoidea virens TaxID=1159556 RepID=A0A8E5HKJ8_USTVR|nr:uncharacterized protein UV8b_01233 [Ustilaginoidea virens]QUC16992.1 hypothetical protein UV8b_01233 [Ustilaginoidea virens]